MYAELGVTVKSFKRLALESRDRIKREWRDVRQGNRQRGRLTAMVATKPTFAIVEPSDAGKNDKIFPPKGLSWKAT